MPDAAEQRCWVHNTARVLDALPKRLESKRVDAAARDGRSTDQGRRHEGARFREAFDAKYPKAVAKLDKEWTALTAFHDFPAEHWRHLRTTTQSS